MADADAALAHFGAASVIGFGLGAYVALLLAGSRPERVRGAILCDGAGLEGGGPEPGPPRLPPLPDAAPRAPDPFALAELSRDVRPPDYAEGFAEQAAQLSGLARPISVCAAARPPWLAAVLAVRGAAPAALPEALAYYAGKP